MEVREDFYIPTNEYQTEITKDFIESLEDEVAEQFLDFVTNVEYIRNLISPTRKRAKDLPRDDEGKIIVDVTNPHILEDMDYFRPSAIHFQKYGCYTFLRPNPNPNSEFKKWIVEEKRRCREGYIRESDGEWVTGYMYWYMNYCPIMLTKITEGKKKADRVEGFPETWEGIYLRFHYVQQARENGNHAIELARRGASKSYTLASMMAHNFVLGESAEVYKRVTTILTAYQKEYLADKDGTLSKFEPMINFVSENTEFPRLRLRSSSQDMFWLAGYQDEYGRKKGSLNSVMGVSSKDDSGKLRGKRGHIYFEEIGSFPNLLEIFDIVRQGMEEGDYTYGLAFLVGCVCKGTLVCKPNGEQIPIEKLTPEDGIVGFNKENFTLTNEPISNPIKPEPTTCYRITLSNNNILECSWDHPILVAVIHTSRINGTNRRNIYYSYEWKLAKDITHKDKICESRVVGVFGKEKLFDARLIGMLIGDGSYGIHNSIKYSSQDYELQNYVESKYDAVYTRGHITKNGKPYKEYRIRGLCQGLRESGIYGQTRTNKRLPSNYQKLDRENTILLLSGLYDTDGTICYKEQRSSLEITQSNETILKEINILWRKFGVYGSIQKVNPVIREGRKDKNPWYNLIIAGGENLTRALSVLSPLIRYKKESSTKILNFYKSYQYKCVSNIDKSIICYHAINVECIGIKEVYHLTTDNTHTYLANGIITHNTAAEKASNFESAKTLLYNTDAYNIYTIKNVYDKPKQGKPTFGYFFPAYVNRKGCYNKDGVSDVVKALVQILRARHKAKYGSDPNSVIRVIAEMPITPAEAIIKVRNAYFPVASLTERLQQIDLDPKAYDDVYVGNLILKGNNVEFKHSDDVPIRKYGVDNSMQGALEMYELPQKNSSGKIYEGRYIIGHDPVDNDQAESTSLSSTFVLDLYTDRIVAEYTGRQQLADDNFEIVRLLCLYYNAKCLYEAHPYSQLVHTPNGDKLWKDIQIGDYLFSPTKGVVKVTDIPVDEYMDIYKVKMSDGRVIEASDNHIWLVYKGISKTPIEVTTKQMLEDGLINKYGQHKYFIPEHRGADYNRKDLPIDPYTMGLLLSEGSLRGSHCTKNYVQISSSFEDMKFYECNIPYSVKHVGNKGFSWHVKIPNCKAVLSNYGLYGTNSHTKFIPKDYLLSHRVQRMELLKGIMDGDGCARTKGASILITCSEKLAKDVLTLVRSLGIKGWLQTSREGVYRVAIASEFKVFKLPRKVVNQYVYRPYTKGSKASAILNKTAIDNIEFSHKEMGKCVTVDSDDGLYLIGDYVVTHNCNKKGIFAYFQKMQCTHLLADTPEYLRDRQLVKYSSFGSNAKGVNATGAINDYADRLTKDWLNRPVSTIIVEDGVEKEVKVPNLYFIRSRALLDELINYDPVRNFDRVRALGMVMLYREEKMILYGGNLNAESSEKVDRSYLGNDDFFSRNYMENDSQMQ